MDFIIATDSCCDLPLWFIQENEIQLFSLTVHLDDKEFPDDLGKSYDYHTFYDGLRNGAAPTTSQVNSYTFKEKFETWIKEGKAILYIGFSSAVSGTYSSGVTAKDELLEDYPDAKIITIDTLCASGGQGLLVYYAAKMKKEGKSLDEIVSFIETTKNEIFHAFIVDDLNHLVRGGRLKPSAAFLGNLLQLKPVLYLSEAGSLVAHQKARGRKKAIKALLEYYHAYHVNENDMVCITHGDCPEDANYLAAELKETYNVQNIIVNPIGCVIGSHTGANVLALFFLANTKTPKDSL